jgi:hypothetical protein
MMADEQPSERSSPPDEGELALVRAHERLTLLGGARGVQQSAMLAVGTSASLPPSDRRH